MRTNWLAILGTATLAGCAWLVFPWEDDGRRWRDDTAWRDTWGGGWDTGWRPDTGDRGPFVDVAVRCTPGAPVTWSYEVTTATTMAQVSADVAQISADDWSTADTEAVVLTGSGTAWTATVTTSQWACDDVPTLAWRFTADDGECGLLGTQASPYWNGEKGSGCAWCLDLDGDCS